MDELKEKVIKALYCRRDSEMRCGNPCEETGNCKYATLIRDPSGEPYYPYICDRKKLCEDTISLLKAQEAVPVIQHEVMHMLVWCCGSCGVAITDGDKFCRMCGKPVKWND